MHFYVFFFINTISSSSKGFCFFQEKPHTNSQYFFIFSYFYIQKFHKVQMSSFAYFFHAFLSIHEKKILYKKKNFFFPDKIPKLLKHCILKACRQFFTKTTKREIIDVKNRRLSHEHVTRWISFSTFPSKRFFLIFIFRARTKTIGKKRRKKEQTIALINYT